jgi:hypothetical protein
LCCEIQPCPKPLQAYSTNSPGLPDDIFSFQKSGFWYIFEDIGMENASTFYGYLEYFIDLCYILRPFVIFFPFWYVVARKIWQPLQLTSLPLVTDCSFLL